MWIPCSISTKGIANDLFGSEAAIASPREEKKRKTPQDVDDFLEYIKNFTKILLNFFADFIRSLSIFGQPNLQCYFLRVHEIKKHMFLFHYGKHKEIDGNHNARTSMLPINVFFSWFDP